MKQIYAYTLTVALFASCGKIPDYRTLVERDIRPPQLLGCEAESPSAVTLFFDEKASLIQERILVSPELGFNEATGSGNSVSLSFTEQQVPGKQYIVEGSVRDENGNTLNFLIPFYGYNPDIPGIVINEFTPRGSGTHPDSIELFCRTEGSVAGLCLYAGTKNLYAAMFIFPDLRVKAGDYIVLHCNPQGIAQEKNETISKMESGGYDASPEAWDFWLAEGTGLSSNNGAIGLYTNPSGKLLDCVLYSNRTSTSDDRYRGFGSADMLHQAEELANAGAWRCAEDAVRPEDAVNPDGTTGTRTLCRNSTSEDTNGKEDWHIVPTRGFSYGRSNSDERYTVQEGSARGK